MSVGVWRMSVRVLKLLAGPELCFGSINANSDDNNQS